VANLTNVENVYCGSFHTMFLLKDGTVMGCGKNNNGQLGYGNIIDSYVAKYVKDSNGKNFSNVKKIACGTFHTFFLKHDETLHVCGKYYINNISLSLNPVNFARNVTNIFSGHFSIIYVVNYTSFNIHGYNLNGLLGTIYITEGYILEPYVLTLESSIISAAISFSHSLFLTSDYKIISSGNNSKGQLGIGTFINFIYKNITLE
jgi:alpha-tubulin suppressor-like RCC1 family protein